MSVGKTSSKSSSKPLKPDEVAGYFGKLDELTGGTPGGRTWVEDGGTTTSRQLVDGAFVKTEVPSGHWENTQGQPGRLSTFAQQGTPAVDYQALTQEDIKALGGLGATRMSQVDEARRQAAAELAADPSMTLYQRQRATQMNNRDTNDRMDAILKETEAAIATMAQEEARRQYESDVNKAKLTREDLEALANIFYGGMGNTSSSKSSGFNLGL